MPINLCLVGSSDREFEQLLRDCGMRVTLLSRADLDTLAQATTTQPDVVVVDLREQSHVPPALTLLRRQHPVTGIVIVASLDPVLMLEAMRAGVTECITEPLNRADLEAAIARVVTQRPMGRKRVRCSRSWARRAVSAPRPWRSTSRPRSHRFTRTRPC